MLEACSEACGWLAGVLAAVSFGSFGVPIKSTSNLSVDPMVMQSYKSAVCFLTCWLVIPLGVPPRFTSWGIISGLFWVPGATAGIYGIRNAGLAISVGVWSALIVISSFGWGIFVFDEKVKSIKGALLGAFILMIGLIGMAFYSAPEKSAPEKKKKEIDGLDSLLVPLNREESLEVIESYDDDQDGFELSGLEDTERLTKATRRKRIDGSSSLKRTGSKADVCDLQKETELLVLCGGKIIMTKRTAGIIGAAINGAWGSNNMIPMHYARAQGFHGASYLISYSCGSMIVTIAMWVLRYFVNLHRFDFDWKKAYLALPSFHFQEMWRPGFLSGLLYSLGNFCSIITVAFLGQGVGYSFIQTSMLISGLWGIFYFGEVKGSKKIGKWLISSSITVTGILLLSYEHTS